MGGVGIGRQRHVVVEYRLSGAVSCALGCVFRLKRVLLPYQLQGARGRAVADDLCAFGDADTDRGRTTGTNGETATANAPTRLGAEHDGAPRTSTCVHSGDICRA